MMGQKWLGGPSGGVGGVRRPYWMTGRDREGRKGSGVPQEAGRIWRLYQRAGRGQKAFLETQGVPPVVGSPTKRAERG